MKLRKKVFGMNLGITSVMIILIGIFVVISADNYNLYTVYRYLIHNSDSSQIYITQYLSEKSEGAPQAVLLRDIPYLEGSLKRQVGCEVRITGNSAHGDLRPEQEKALEGKKTYIVEKVGSKRVFFMAFPIIINGSVIGAIDYQYSLQEVDAIRKELILVFLGILLMVFVLVLLLSYRLSYRLINPLEKLQETARAYSKGDFEVKPSIRTGDEVEELGKALTGMGQDIEKMIGDLKEEQAKQKRFLDSVTHEIRTPLTNIMGYSELLGKVSSEKDKQKCIEAVQNESKRMLRMVESLLDLAQLRQYQLVVDKKKLDLNRLIADVADIMGLRGQKYGFRIVTRLEPVEAWVDEDKIKQLLMNLLDNAIKYSEGDTILVHLWKEQEIYIQVKDNGQGIPEKQLESIMEPFVRVDKSRSRRLGGAGLGLSICREIVEKHGGEMRIESELGKGTTVTIWLHP